VTGKLLGNYEVLDKLGEGGMGEVWRARDNRLNRMVAVKMLPRDMAGDPARRARFEQEARALGALNHPNIVTVYDVGEDGGRAYIVSELVEGESLRAMLDGGPLPAQKAIDIGGQIAEGMAAAHTLGIVHRDLKPENVMVTRAGQVKVLDFGLAKQSPIAVGEHTATMAMPVSEPGLVMGTVGYMSPEQVRAEPVDARSDIFSFGCILYEMLAGRRAFQAPTAVETMHAILKADPLEFEAGSTHIRPALISIVRRCLEKRPEQRFQSAADLAFALRSIDIIGAAPVPRKQRLWPAAAALAIALALVAFGLLLRERARPREGPQFQRITFHKGHVTSARFVPHSRNVLYEASWEGGPSHVYLTVPGSPESRDLLMPPDSQLLSVSANQDIAFLAAPFNYGIGGRLMRGSLSGAQMRPLLDGVIAADWAPDGSSLAVLRRANAVNRLEYPIGTVLADNIARPRSMIRVSPEGDRVAYTRLFRGRAIELMVVDRAGKQTSLGAISGQNTTDESSDLCWTPKGDQIWFRSFDPAEPGTVYAVDLHGKRRMAAILPSRVKLYDIARNGDALLSTGSSQLGILGMAPGATAERDLSCLDSGRLAGISDDGQVIAANITGESGGPKGSIYARRTDGSPAFRVADGHAYRLSPDGNWVSGYTLNRDGSRRFLLLPTGPGEESDIHVPGLQLGIVFGWLDGDRRYLVFGHLTGKKWQCFAWDAVKGTAQAVCPEGVPDSLSYFVSPDRKQVLTPGPGSSWFVYPADGGTARKVHGIAPNEVPIGWRQDSRSVYVQTRRDDAASLPVSIVDTATGARSPWKVIHPSQPVLEARDLWITPDGRAYAYNFLVAQSDLYVAHGLN
jgi:eukaryotic-like serine/threonine-protein kinase